MLALHHACAICRPATLAPRHVIHILRMPFKAAPGVGALILSVASILLQHCCRYSNISILLFLLVLADPAPSSHTGARFTCGRLQGGEGRVGGRVANAAHNSFLSYPILIVVSIFFPIIPQVTPFSIIPI